MDEFTNVHVVAAWGFVVAAVFGFVANKTNFCTMGAISDAVNMGSKGRLGAWLGAMGIAILGTQALAYFELVDLTTSRYLSPSLGWLGALLGGFVFGIGMTLGAGCGQKNVVRLGAGSLKALVVLVVMGITAYATVRGLIGLLRVNFIEPTNWNLGAYGLKDQTLTSVLSVVTGIEGAWLGPVLALAAGGALLAYALAQPEFRRSGDNVLAALVVGAAVVAAWFVTGYVGKDDFDPVPAEALSFIASTGNTINYLMTFTGSTINFGIAVVLGTLCGSLAYALLSRSFRVETFSGRTDMTNHLIGGVLMGFGGVLALGCTIGQGVSGLSTLAVGSVIAVPSIMFGSALTMKVQYHLLDGDHGWAGAVALGARELLLPGGAVDDV